MNTKFSRQVHALGVDTQRKIHTMTVLVIGLDTMGTEIAKNLAMSGVKKILLWDKKTISEKDIDDNFLLMYPIRAKVGHLRSSSVCQSLLALIDNNVEIITLENEDCIESNNIDFIYLTDANESIKYWNQKARLISAHFAAGQIHNDRLWGWFDPGPQFIVHNASGERQTYWNVAQNNEHIILLSEIPTDIGDDSIIELYGNGTPKIAKIIKSNATWIEIDQSIQWKIEAIKLVPPSIVVEGSVYEYPSPPDCAPSVSYSSSVKLAALLSHELLKMSGSQTPFCGELIEELAKKTDTMCNISKTSKIVLIGAGALGCEYLKNLGMLQFENILLVDADSISISNTTRQLLYQETDVGKSKAQTACRKLKAVFPSCTVECLEMFIDQSSYDQIDWHSVSLILNAVDNRETRIFIDELSVYFQIPLIDCGTLSSKAHAQFIVPNATESYNDSQDNTNDEEIPVCTIKEFPYKVEHCVAWAKELHTTLFRNTTKQKREASEIFKKCFIEDVKQLISAHSDDFWTTCKKPIPLTMRTKLFQQKKKRWLALTDAILNSADDTPPLDWLIETSQLRADVHNILVQDRDSIIQILENITPALQTTTAYVVGHVCHCLENDLCQNLYANLAINLHVLSDTCPPKKIVSKCFDELYGIGTIAIPENHTKWHILDEYISDTKLEWIVNYLNTKYSMSVLNIRRLDKMVYSSLLANENQKDISINVKYSVDAISATGKIVLLPAIIFSKLI